MRAASLPPCPPRPRSATRGSRPTPQVRQRSGGSHLCHHCHPVAVEGFVLPPHFPRHPSLPPTHYCLFCRPACAAGRAATCSLAPFSQPGAPRRPGGGLRRFDSPEPSAAAAPTAAAAGTAGTAGTAASAGHAFPPLCTVRGVAAAASGVRGRGSAGRPAGYHWAGRRRRRRSSFRRSFW